MVKHANPDLINTILDSLDESVLVVRPEHIKSIHREGKKIEDPRVIKDVTTKRVNDDDFFLYFRNRYARLSELIGKRINAVPIESLNKNKDRGDFRIIGMVYRINTTARGNKLITVEDHSGMTSVLVPKGKGKGDIIIMLDEVIGITGRISNGLLIADTITHPGVPISFSPRKSHVPASAILTSDLHVGSKMFLEDAWNEFINWLDANAEGNDIRYMVIAGDIVDGIGVYPGQEKQLLIHSIHEQYEKAAELLAEVPDHIRIIIAPGNHDAVRVTEPQPALPNEIRTIFDRNITFVGNPSLIELCNVRILIYHGRSLEDFIFATGISAQKPATLMREMLRRRHLSPVYGNHVPILPCEEDQFVIDTIPEILHCGHIHVVDVSKYRNVTLVNSGAWQEQTDYQRRLGVMPTPANVPVVDLQSLGVKMLRFR
jgi:DNA polymerase II small subunit